MAHRPHLPHRPLWLCRACAAPWPCGRARLALLAEFAHDRVGLSVYLCSALYEAVGDLHRLNPHDAPDPRDLFDRFVAWPGRRPGAEGVRSDESGPAEHLRPA